MKSVTAKLKGRSLLIYVSFASLLLAMLISRAFAATDANQSTLAPSPPPVANATPIPTVAPTATVSPTPTPSEEASTLPDPDLEDLLADSGIDANSSQSDIDSDIAEPDINQQLPEPDLNQDLTEPDLNQDLTEPEIDHLLTEPDLNQELSEPDLNQELAEPNLDPSNSNGYEPDLNQQLLEPDLEQPLSEPTTGDSLSEPDLNQGLSDGSSSLSQTKNYLVFQIDNYFMNKKGEKYKLDTPPSITNGRTLIPLRAIVEGVGGTVKWDPKENKADLSFGVKQIRVWSNSNTARVNGTDKTLDVPASIVNGRLMIPLRFIMENFGFTVKWNETYKKVTVIIPS